LNKYEGSTDIDFYLHHPSWSQHKTLAKRKIAYFYWEADILPPQWIRGINEVNEIWAPCTLVSNACRRAGFKGSIKIIPTPGRRIIKNNDLSFALNDKKILSNDFFIFYSIFQWSYRKGFDVLLNAYFSQFSKKDNVILVLKVNPVVSDKYQKDYIIKELLEIKSKYKKDLPLIYLSDQIIDVNLVNDLHFKGHCYVAPHRGEGWGMPIFDAMQAGSYIITTPFGGITEFLDKNHFGALKYKMGPVKNMEWSPYYNARQNWAYPSETDLAEKMYNVYKNYESDILL
jgi:glycosyltransferase involved in cell wall biosynthesis